jgi:hypothetical protein
MDDNWLLYDAEIWRCIPDREEYLLDEFDGKPGFEYCNGWHDFDGMGISCVGWATSLGSKGVFVFDLKNIPSVPTPEMLAFQMLASSVPLVVGFNSLSFDDNLMRAYGINLTTGYDLLNQIRLQGYGSTDWRDSPKGWSYKLDRLARANNIPPKTGSGGLAPVLWQQGQRQEVLDYCLHDVEITVQVLELGLKGQLVDPNTGRLLTLPSIPCT